MATQAAREPQKVESTRNYNLPEIKSQDLGLEILFQPEEADDIDADIVAVHGIGVHPKSTWVFKENQVNWLKNETMLPAALPKARIMAFGYASYWFGNGAVKQTLDGASTKLLQALSHVRTGCPYRPIIFIGHCFGGLIIQQAYTIAKLHQIDEDFLGIYDSITGIVFLGTPHHGVSDSSQLRTQSQLYNAIVNANIQVQPNILHTIAHDNDVLVKCVHDFTRVVELLDRSESPQLYCFFEQMESKIGQKARMPDLPPEFIVNETSGTLSGHPKEGLPLDHFSMNKFEDSRDGNYIPVSGRIRKMVKASKAIMERRKLDDSTGPSPFSTPRHHIPSLAAPISRESHFAPRGGILSVIEEKFKKTVRVVLCGVEYAHQFHREHPGSNILWVNAGSAAEFVLSYKLIAEKLHLGRKELKNSNVVEAVHDTLKQDVSAHWLMVLDGLDDAKILKSTEGSLLGKSLLEYVPQAHFARVLITTRSKSLATRMVNQKDQYVIEVSTLKDEDASFLLLGRKTSDSAKMKSSTNVAKLLGGSAGTLTMAYLYLQTTKQNWKTFKEKIRSQDETSKVDSGTLRAWQLLYYQIKERYAVAAHMLLLLGSLNVQSIPTIFFDRDQLFDQIPRLVEAGMVEPSTDKRVYTVTALIRQCVQKWLIQIGEKEVFEERALSVMCNKFAENEYETSELLLPCALAVLKFQPKSVEGKRELATLLSRVGHYYMHANQYHSAIGHLERCLAICEEDQEREDELATKTRQALETAKSNIVQSGPELKSREKSRTPTDNVVKETERLKELEKSVGQEHPDTMSKLSDVATLQLMRGDKKGTTEALQTYQRILDWCKKKYGAENLDTARRQYNLAIAYEEQGDYDNAAALYRSASQIAERYLGPGHPELLRILGNLALMYYRQGQLETAQQAFNVVLLGQKETLGWDHPNTLMTRQNIAMMLEEQGQAETAGDELENIVRVQARLLGLKHRATLQTSCNLAINYASRGMRQDAKHLLSETLRIQKEVLGEVDRDTAITKEMLSKLKGEARKSK
ncbi:hypothetical protein K449DRAFT_376402 [Hypoxylon sp. EC38]|nr:hypothetical protein K449DRAFT_376402 [Hypoxylon sp. EC38]